MRLEEFSFGSIRIDGVTHEHDVVIDRGEIRKRKKKPSKRFREEVWTHTLVRRGRDTLEMPALLVGTGAYGGLPVMKEVKLEAERRKIELLVLPTAQAIEALKQ